MNKSRVTKNQYMSIAHIHKPNLLYAVLGIVLYRIALDIVYVKYLSPLYSYSDFTCNLSVKCYVISWVILMPFIPLIIAKYKRYSIDNSIIAIIALLALVPSTSLFAFKPMDIRFLVLYVIYWMMLFVYDNITPKIKIRVSSDIVNQYLIGVIAIILCIVVVYVSVRYTGFRLNFSITNVYDLRSEAKGYNMPIILQYLLSAAGNVLPLILMYYLSEKKNNKAIALGVILFIDFSIGGHKSVLAKLLICIAGYRFFDKFKISWMSWSLFVFTIFAGLEKLLLDSYLLIGLIIRRVLYVPALLNYYYYDFFTINEVDYFQQGFLRWFGFSSSYNINISHIIGYYYFNNIDTGANNGLFSDAYSNLGVAGVLVMPFVLVFIIRIIGSAAKGLSKKFHLLAILITAFGLISSSFSTVLLTHGILLMTFVLFCIPHEHEANRNTT